MIYILASMMASGIFVVAGLRGKQSASLASASGPYGRLIDPLWPTDSAWGDAEIDLAETRPIADVGTALRLTLRRLTPILASQSVQAEIAAPSGLLVRMRGATLMDLLEELLTAAIQSAPACRLLLTATRRGDGICVGITDDMPCADITVRTGGVRGLKQRVAMRGGTLRINVRPNEGATLTLRLPAAVEQSGRDRALPAPAKGSPAPSIPIMGDAAQLR